MLFRSTQKPTITCATPAASYPSSTGACTYTVPNIALDPSFSDNCTGSTVTNNYTNTATLNGAVFPLGSTVVLWTVTDGSGNTATCSQTISVIDTQKPTITCATPAASYPSSTGACTYTVPNIALDPSFSDNCTGSTVTNNYTNTATLNGAVFPLGSTVVLWTVTDGSGNTATCSQTISVIDTQKPTITCATPAASYPSDAGLCSYTVPNTSLDPIYGDNCTGPTVKIGRAHV